MPPPCPVRPGLVTVGVAFLVLGAGTVASIYALPMQPTTDQQSTVVPLGFVAGHGGGQASLSGTDSSAASFRVQWSSSVNLSVDLYDAPGCSASGSCVLTNPVRSWTGNTSGDVTVTGALAFPFVLVWSNPSDASGSFQAQAVETYHAHGALPTLTLLLVDGTAGTLILVGGVGLFLGLFLRGGVYRAPPGPRAPPGGPRP